MPYYSNHACLTWDLNQQKCTGWLLCLQALKVLKQMQQQKSFKSLLAVSLTEAAKVNDKAQAAHMQCLDLSMSIAAGDLPDAWDLGQQVCIAYAWLCIRLMPWHHPCTRLLVLQPCHYSGKAILNHQNHQKRLESMRHEICFKCTHRYSLRPASVARQMFAVVSYIAFCNDKWTAATQTCLHASLPLHAAGSKTHVSVLARGYHQI